jgi:hypothetical protein
MTTASPARRGRPAKSKRSDDPRSVTIRIEVTEEELEAINLRTTPRQRAVVLAQMAERLKQIEIEVAVATADWLTGYGDHEPKGDLEMEPLLFVNHLMSHFETGLYCGTTDNSLHLTRRAEGEKIQAFLNECRARYEASRNAQMKSLLAELNERDEVLHESRHGGGLLAQIETLHSEANHYEGYEAPVVEWERRPGEEWTTQRWMLLNGTCSVLVTLTEDDEGQQHIQKEAGDAETIAIKFLKAEGFDAPFKAEGETYTPRRTYDIFQPTTLPSVEAWEKQEAERAKHRLVFSPEN